MRIRYRYAPYGTNFEHRGGVRPADERVAHALYENEAAADVGGAFWRDDRPVIDHHFARDGQFPSASAAVLHSARRVYAWWEKCRSQFEEVWLVTHVNPDFDALASLYLIRSLEDWPGFEPL